jgi:hypothetical protein
VVGSNACAALLAPWAVGNDTRAVGSPDYYMRLWLYLALGFAVWWMYQQWRDRPSLPRQRALPWGWSSAVNTVVIMSMFSVVVTAGRSAEDRVRMLRSAAQLHEDIRAMEAFVGDSYWRRVMPEHYFKAWRRSATEGSARLFNEASVSERPPFPWETLAAYVPNTFMTATRTCAETFFIDEKYTKYRVSCERYVKGSNSLMLTDGLASQECMENFEDACNVFGLEQSLENNFLLIAVSHRLIDVWGLEERLSVILQFIYISLFCVSITNCAGLFSPSRGIIIVGILTLFAGLVAFSGIVNFGPGVIRVREWKWIELPQVFSAVLDSLFYGVVYVILLGFMTVTMLWGRARSTFHDITAVLFQFWPIFVLFVYGGNDFDSRTASRYYGLLVMSSSFLPSQEYLLYCSAIVGCTLLSSLLLSRYRTLPQFT